MDIAVIGPEKFAFQDMACIELALSYRQFGTLSLVPEPSGGEDASLSWDGSSVLTLEVQVKGAKGTAGIKELADYLVHFPSRKAKGSFFERLLSDDTRHALFILTARCKDELVPLLRERSLAGRPATRQVPRELAKALRDAVGKMASVKLKKKPTKLKQERLSKLAALATRPIADFERALGKTNIIDQETAETIEVRLHAALRTERYDTQSIRGILARLTDLLAESKHTQKDAFNPILSELSARAPSAVRPDGYLERGIETNLDAQLRNRNVLLLAGPPRAGKSWTARAIAGKLQIDGFEIRQGTFVEEAERFLTEAAGAERSYMLDDPIGAREPLSDASARLAALSALIERIPANRRLIVAQSEQVLFETRAVTTLADCALGGEQWQRLEPLPVDRAQAIWQAAANAQALLGANVEHVVELIAREPELRDPGALAYLAQTWSELPESPLDNEILHQARRDASDFARSLAEKAPDIRDLLTASALATTASEGAAATEFAFIVNGGTDRPGLENFMGVIEFGSKTQQPPAYLNQPILSSGQQHALDALQRRRVLEERDSLFNFTHPYLRAGAQTLVSPDIPRDQESILGQVERAIACSSPVTSLAAARNLYWLRLAFPTDGSSAVFELANSGIRSLFPATRDCCFEFLIEFADQLPDTLKEKVPYWSERMVTTLNHIDVEHGIGFIIDQPDLFPKASPLVQVQTYLDAIEDGEPLGLDLSLSRRLLQTLDENPEALTHTAALRFLRTDEAVVRAAVAQIWCRLPREDDADILQRLETDIAPAISVALLEALARNWETLEESRRERILTMLIAHAHSPGCASVLLTRLVLFNRVEYFGEQPPWHVFAALMPVVIAHLPLSVSFDNGRFNVALNYAVQSASGEALSPVIEAWAARLLRRLERYFLNESELAIVDPLIEIATTDVRLAILRNLYDVSDTGARVVTTKWLASRWNELSQAERELLEEAVRDTRGDVLWLAATVLTRDEPPQALINALTGDPETLALSPKEIELGIGPKLFSACVRVFVGWPQPLWWFATHHSQNPTWKRVIHYLGHAPSHPLHAEAFYEIASFGAEGDLADLVTNLPASALGDTFDRLLDFKIAHVGDWRRDAWQRLLTRADEEQLLDSFIERIDAELEGILEKLADIYHWLGKEGLAERILGLLPNDAKAIIRARNLLECYKGMQTKAEEMEREDPMPMAEIFARLCAEEWVRLESEPPRLHGSWGEIGKIFSDIGAPAETCAAVEIRRLEAIDCYKAIKERFEGAPPKVELEGWIDQAQ